MMQDDRPIYWLGTDEAGYGSKLGPLVITASAWKIANQIGADWDFSDANCINVADQLDWHQTLSDSKRPDSLARQILDSKKLYSAGKSLEGLQRIVTSFLAATSSAATGSATNILEEAASCYSDLVQSVVVEDDPNYRSYWCTNESEVKFKSAADLDSLERDTKIWQNNAVQAVGCKSAVIDETKFNAGLIDAGNKATLLSRHTLALVQQWLQQLSGPAKMIVDLDRHGGRKKYLPLLLEATSADWIEVIDETPEVSSYRWSTADRTIYFRFSIKGERRFPVAMASIFSKLIRERAMECFNRYWKQQKPSIVATAGYPVDAERFKRDCDEVRLKLKLADNVFWRNA